ncbi:tripartite tricarboxylate transporter TctB family protein [Ancylobacter oerskovii]|uniref:Tripartite tricarboxylate transporter TctB family protein n=1 Tax=Ancylobacter oerskovii TaxID=459519 RepID=A0ABW4YZK6_9HYPH|nr:tripartite tricarboxylate transporter TctB family protein [Ancylobacter oerskovii]MBS7543888.1 tripartite tricarboxylate transporter TctB family protein [Ancylobacter oerskovii]
MDISRSTMDIAAACATAAVGAVVCYGATLNGTAWGSSGPEPGYFPFYVGCLIILGSAGTVVQTLLRRAGGRQEHGAEGEAFLDGERLRTVVAFFLPIVAMAAISAWLGLYIGMGLYIFYALRVAAGFRTLPSLVSALAVVAVNFVIFEKLFMVPLLKGPVLEAFGIY